MTKEFNTTNTASVVETKEVVTDKAQITSVTVSSEMEFMVVSISFGTGTPFVAQLREMWLITGDLYTSIISGAPSGKTFGDLIDSGAESLIQSVKGDEQTYQGLLASGQLKISSGNFTDFIGK